MKQNENKPSDDKPVLELPGVVEKIIQPMDPNQPEKVQIAIDGAEELYSEIRVENTLKHPTGEEVALTPGAEVDVRVEAEPEVTCPKKKKSRGSPPDGSDQPPTHPKTPRTLFPRRATHSILHLRERAIHNSLSYILLWIFRTAAPRVTVEPPRCPMSARHVLLFKCPRRGWWAVGTCTPENCPESAHSAGSSPLSNAETRSANTICK